MNEDTTFSEPSLDGITLAQAHAVINAHYAAEVAERIETAKAYIGRYFVCPNSYDGDRSWMLYGCVEHVTEGGWPKGWTFQEMVDGIFQVETSVPMHVVDSTDWREITPEEFAAALRSFRNRLDTSLAAFYFAPEPSQSVVTDV